MEAKAYVVIVEGAEPARLREVIEAEGWQMPLAPLLADGDMVAVVRLMAERRAVMPRHPESG